MANPFGRSPVHDSWGALFIVGLVALIGGVLAFARPFTASLTVVAIAGFAFIALGVFKLIYATRIRSDRAYIVSLLLAALMILLGAAIWVNPVAGLVSLTALVAVLFLVMGFFKLIFALMMRPGHGWGWVLLSGAISLLLGIAIFANFPAAAATILGLMLGIELISTGLGFIFAAIALRNY